MCPENQLLSLYLDGELPSPWKEKMETHLEQCSGCKEKMESYRQLQHGLREKDTDLELINTAKERVWQNLQSMQPQQLRRFSYSNSSRQTTKLWQRRLSIPIPAAAAAAVVLAVMGTLLIRGGTNHQLIEPATKARMILAADDALPAIIPATDMSGVIQYLGYDGTDIIILRLPESSNFISSGEPEIVRAADYRRNESPRRHR